MVTRHPADLVLALLLAVVGVLEVLLTGSPRPVVVVALTLVAAAALLLRTTRPVLALTAFVGLVVLSEIPALGVSVTGTLVVGCLAALAGVGRWADPRTSVLAMAGTVAVLVVGAAFRGRPWDVVVTILACGAAWGAGRLLRREDDRNAALEMVTHELERRREASAQEAVRIERARIARELHDTVAHAVSVMTLQVGGVRRRLDRESGLVRERDALLDVEALGREAVAELHRMLDVMRGVDDPDPDLGAPQPRLADVEQLVARVRAAGLPVELSVVGTTRPLPAGIELTGYRVVQEALTNVVKHAAGARVQVTVTYRDAELLVAVEDTAPGEGSVRSAGISPERAAEAGSEETDGPAGRMDPRTGHGLRGLRERVALYGGRVEAGREARGGFVVRATLPVLTP